jgi:uncharacterized DUF497 family protein
MRFRWNAWNVEHVADHGMAPSEAEYVVDHARRPYPRMVGDEKRLVIGPTRLGLHAQVVYVLDDDGVAYVIHCRPLTPAEKRRYRKRKS